MTTSLSFSKQDTVFSPTKTKICQQGLVTRLGEEILSGNSYLKLKKTTSPQWNLVPLTEKDGFMGWPKPLCLNP